MPEIKYHYGPVIRDIAGMTADQPAGADVGFRIAPTATYAESIAYAMRHVVSGGDHFRYDRYRSLLDAGFRELRYRTAVRRPLLHVDIGCGPGLFIWVLLDQLRGERNAKNQQHVAVNAIGYEHSPSMVRLAENCSIRLQRKVNASAEPGRWSARSHFPKARIVCGHEEFVQALQTEIRRDGLRDVIVTFGHVLVQTAHDRQAIETFTGIMTELAKLNFRRYLLFASDAYSGYRRDAFDRGWDSLLAALKPALKLKRSADIRASSSACAELERG